jgi:pSer/pThr/pTyr-binding forkhead associated (FHA) protein
MDIKLIMTKTDGQQKEIPVTGDVITIGRGKDCNLRIPIESCSRKQCQLFVEDEALKIKDLGSSNGTYVNNQRVEEAVLNAGDRLTIGPIVLTVQIDGEPAEVTTTTPVDLTTPATSAEEELIPVSEGGGEEDPFLHLAKEAGTGEDALAAAAAESTEEEDPIAALEALADLQKDKEE